jgi:hypothetical protein
MPFRRRVVPNRITALAALLAGIIGGVPSTLYAVASGGNWLDSINAIAAITNAENLSFGWRICVATVIHFTISFFWATALMAFLPQRRVLLCASAAGGAIAVIDLLLLAPILFPEVAALSFWPQLADHVVWGGAVGAVFKRTVKHLPE